MTVAEKYIAEADARHRPELERLDQIIRAALPGAEPEEQRGGFIMYVQDGAWLAGFASRKKGVMAYIPANGVLDRHESELEGRRSGKSCVDYDPSLDPLIKRMLEEISG